MFITQVFKASTEIVLEWIMEWTCYGIHLDVDGKDFGWKLEINCEGKRAVNEAKGIDVGYD